jgi:hypothetical protein
MFNEMVKYHHVMVTRMVTICNYEAGKSTTKKGRARYASHVHEPRMHCMPLFPSTGHIRLIIYPMSDVYAPSPLK